MLKSRYVKPYSLQFQHVLEAALNVLIENLGRLWHQELTLLTPHHIGTALPGFCYNDTCYSLHSQTLTAKTFLSVRVIIVGPYPVIRMIWKLFHLHCLMVIKDRAGKLCFWQNCVRQRHPP